MHEDSACPIYEPLYNDRDGVPMPILIVHPLALLEFSFDLI